MCDSCESWPAPTRECIRFGRDSGWRGEVQWGREVRAGGGDFVLLWWSSFACSSSLSGLLFLSFSCPPCTGLTPLSIFSPLPFHFFFFFTKVGGGVAKQNFPQTVRRRSKLMKSISLGICHQMFMLIVLMTSPYLPIMYLITSVMEEDISVSLYIVINGNNHKNMVLSVSCICFIKNLKSLSFMIHRLQRHHVSSSSD